MVYYTGEFILADIRFTYKTKKSCLKSDLVHTNQQLKIESKVKVAVFIHYIVKFFNIAN